MTTELALVEENRALAADFGRQKELFAKFGYKDPGSYLMGHYAIEKTPEGGWKMVTRERPVNFEFDDNGRARCIIGLQKTYAERLGGMQEERLTNPDTARAVIENLLCQSVEVGEVAEWASI